MQDCSNKLLQKSVLCDCISVCFDICTINIRVSIRVRGLLLVSKSQEGKQCKKNHFSRNGRNVIDGIDGGFEIKLPKYPKLRASVRATRALKSETEEMRVRGAVFSRV